MDAETKKKAEEKVRTSQGLQRKSTYRGEKNQDLHKSYKPRKRAIAPLVNTYLISTRI